MGREQVPTIPELLETAVEAEVRLVGCQMTMDVMGVKKEDLIDGVEVGGAATFLEYASESALTVFV
jgi:peroxiredoxin family protein